MAITTVRATDWEISQFFRAKADFCCGECERLNRKIQVSPMRWKDHSQVLATSQCKWCGIINAFFLGDRPIVYDF